MCQCEECYWMRMIPMVVRGVMDCDPPEIYCKLNMDEWFMLEDEDLAEYFTEEEIENGCPKFSLADD